MDVVFFVLVLSTFLIWLIPWENLRSLTVAGVGISLEPPQVQGAISGLGLDQIKDTKLRQRLLRLKEELHSVRGSRVLWIDDHPYTILGERRLLRALGIDVTPATSSERAKNILEEDNDFDLIITDVQRRGTSYELVDSGVDIHEGVNFVVKLRKEEKDERIRSLPVIFYGAYPWESLVKFTRPARELEPEPEISNSVDDLIPKIIRRLSEERTSPITYSSKKQPTGV